MVYWSLQCGLKRLRVVKLDILLLSQIDCDNDIINTHCMYVRDYVSSKSYSLSIILDINIHVDCLVF